MHVSCKTNRVCPSNFVQLILLVNFIGAVARLNAAFGQGSGPIILGHVACTGVEPRLFECPNSGLGIEYCSHSSDAGVVCLQGKKIVTLY